MHLLLGASVNGSSVSSHWPEHLLPGAPVKGWSQNVTGSAEKRYSGGRPRIARTMENVDSVETLLLSQEDRPGTHRTIRQVSRETGISRTSVHRIIHKELQMKCFKNKQAQDLTDTSKIARLVRTKQLLRKYSQRLVQFMWFTDEKLFTVTPPVNLQNDRMYVAVPMRKKTSCSQSIASYSFKFL